MYINFPDNQDISCGEGFIEGIKKVNDTNIIIHKIKLMKDHLEVLLFYLII